MSKRFTLVTVSLAVIVAFLVGAILAGGVARSAVTAGAPAKAARGRPGSRGAVAPGAATLVNFADVVERINPAVVNIDTTSRGRDARRRRGRTAAPDSPDPFDGPFDFGAPRDRDAPRRGAGSGFIIDADGSILTNHHVVDRAERITVKLSDGRTVRARLVGSDADTDIALIKVDGENGLPVAPLGDSSTLRMGEWVCAIGSRASSIGFAVPINGASSALPQLRARGRVSRGYMGVGLRDVDADLERSLKLTVDHGALVQDITAGSPADRAGLRPYDIITSLDDRAIASDDQLIREISARAPGSAARLRLVRDGHDHTVTVKLAEPPARDRQHTGDPAPQTPERGKSGPDTLV